MRLHVQSMCLIFFYGLLLAGHGILPETLIHSEYGSCMCKFPLYRAQPSFYRAFLTKAGLTAADRSCKIAKVGQEAGLWIPSMSKQLLYQGRKVTARAITEALEVIELAYLRLSCCQG